VDFTRRYQADAEVTFQRLEDATVLVHLGSGRIHHTNLTGSRIWELLEAGKSLDEALQILGAEFDAPIEQIRKEVAEFVELLEGEKMIAPIADPA